MTPAVTALLVVVIAQSVMLGVLLRLYLHARQLHEQATTRPPDPTAPLPFVDLEARHRWESLDLSLLHELNREEVEKLLAKVRGTGVKSLTAGERAFLDRMSKAVRLS